MHSQGQAALVGRGIVHQPQSDIDQWLFVEAARHEALLGTIWQHTD